MKNETPYAAEREWLRDGNGKEVWIVAIKCTYDIQPDGRLLLSPQQQPVHSGPVQSATTGEMRYETDLGPEKRYTDVIVNGHAWIPITPKRTPVLVGFKIGTVTRLANVYPERPIAHVENIDGFIKVPLIYQNMSTGSVRNGEFYNPHGRKKPAIEFLHHTDSELGFGAISTHWRGRAELAGTYDRHWQATRYPLPPEDLNPLFWQIAPRPQQLLLKGGEKVVLANMSMTDSHHPAMISFYLPRQSLIFTTVFSHGITVEHRPKVHTVILEPEYSRVSIVWHSALPCHAEVNLLKFTRIWEKKRINHINRQPERTCPELGVL
ncbi:DUF2169 domain-containing protein [Serratia rubidaea]|uniref:DUF2169 family type VI secretion system accessory protein n=1 Tax=Serratia rubidaea TaxID=61652 RepID=UPI002DBE9E1A|nr:DUF2169 domain-containing protein [Serratia rubidaea]MEB7585489.1 DUF2169 domain-containing protein [Serratia rubidaea]